MQYSVVDILFKCSCSILRLFIVSFQMGLVTLLRFFLTYYVFFNPPVVLQDNSLMFLFVAWGSLMGDFTFFFILLCYFLMCGAHTSAKKSCLWDEPRYAPTQTVCDAIHTISNLHRNLFITYFRFSSSLINISVHVNKASWILMLSFCYLCWDLREVTVWRERRRELIVE